MADMPKNNIKKVMKKHGFMDCDANIRALQELEELTKQEVTKNIRAVWDEWDLTEMLSLHSSRKWKLNIQALNDALIEAIKADGINAGWINE